jgi:hypothetical protein
MGGHAARVTGLRNADKTLDGNPEMERSLGIHNT